VLVVEVGREESGEAVLIVLVCSAEGREDLVEARLVKIDGRFATVMNAPDEVLDRVAVLFEQLFELEESVIVDVLGLESNEETDALLVEFPESMSFDNICIERGGQLLDPEMFLCRELK
jgi:hypothetical protein